jgi:hypothetical protein
MSVARDITETVCPPRAAFVNYPMGNTLGRPGHPGEQRDIVRSGFAALERMTEPGTIVDLDFDLEAAAPDGRPWQEWVYTEDYRRRLMKKRDGSSYEKTGK